MAPSPSPAWLAALPVPEWDADEPRRAVAEVLRRPELRDDRGLVERALDWFFDWLDRVLGTLSGGESGSVLAWVVVAVLLAVVVFFGVRLVRGMRVDPGAGGATGADIGRPAVDWRAEADAHEQAGRLGDAVRCRYRAAVADLAARGVVEEVPGRTAGTYARLVREAWPAVADDFAAMTAVFERVWYGGRPAGAGDATRMGDLAASVSAASMAGSRS